ncbi:MAG: radical SAM protein [Vicinamibacteria bacterium]|nr:radical SAM protein [Vicinamibacteria bacterium]
MKPRDLRLLVMHVSTRCDQTCAHCSIWKPGGRFRAALGREDRLALIAEAKALGARSVLFTGGEPLLCDHIEALARGARGLGLSVQIATNGLGLRTASAWLDAVDEVYVSVEGPPAVHDATRGSSMFSRLRESVASVLSLARRPRLVGRSVVSSRNAALLEDTVAAARSLGLDGISFLPADSASGAFGGDPSARSFLRPDEAGIHAMLEAVSRLDEKGELGGFVVEDARKLAWMAADLLAGADPRRAPPCNAPEWSSVVEADGGLRPCFFQATVATVGGENGLGAARRSTAYETALARLGEGNPICAGCVCPKFQPRGAHGVAERVRAVLGRALRARTERSGVSA